MDSTFGTNRHQFSLFFIMGRDNFGHGCSLAFFLIDGEDQRKIGRAVEIFKSQMEVECHPMTIVTDYCLAEINALSSHFPRANMYLCKFHVRQAWQRALSRTIYQVSSDHQGTISCMLIELQEQVNVESFTKKKNDLKKHVFYTNYGNFFHYFEKEWSSCEERWALCHRHTHYANMTTTNFCESYNKTVKTYLGNKNKACRMRLDILLDTLLTKVFPAEKDKYKKFHHLEYQSIDQFPVWGTCAHAHMMTIYF